MNIKEKLFTELAPCGIFCGACPSFNKTCLGCSSTDNQQRKSKWSCKIRSCCFKKGLQYCIYCGDFPCNIYKKKLTDTHKDDPRFNYRHELSQVFSRLKREGIENYYEYQKKRWKCDRCKGTIRFYDYKCDICGFYKIINENKLK